MVGCLSMVIFILEAKILISYFLGDLRFVLVVLYRFKVVDIVGDNLQ